MKLCKFSSHRLQKDQEVLSVEVGGTDRLLGASSILCVPGDTYTQNRLTEKISELVERTHESPRADEKKNFPQEPREVGLAVVSVCPVAEFPGQQQPKEAGTFNIVTCEENQGGKMVSATGPRKMPNLVGEWYIHLRSPNRDCWIRIP